MFHFQVEVAAEPPGGGARNNVPTDSGVCVLQAAQVVLIALFELNTPEFTMLLGALPKTFQDGTTKLLHNHLRTASTAISMVTHRAGSDKGRVFNLHGWIDSSSTPRQPRLI